jgi:hypothetical protein
MPPSLFCSLDHDWHHQATRLRSRQALRRWAEAQPALGLFADLDQLILHVHRRGHPATSDKVLASLAGLAASDELAARALLQAMLPGLKALTHSFGWRGDHEETAAAVVAVCWERIRTYPIERRPRRIAANILLDTRQRVIRQYNQPTSEADETRLEDQVSEATAHAGVELLGHVGEALRRCRLDPDEARLILLTRLADVPLSQLAVGSGRGLETMRRRRRAAEARLAAAVA